MSFAAHETRSNLVSALIAVDGTATVYNHSGSVNVIADLIGYFGSPGDGPAPGGTAGLFHTLAPARLLDTRTSTGGHKSPLGADSTVRVMAAGSNGIPANATAVWVNLTATGGTAPTYLTAFASGTPRPTAFSVLNVAAQTTTPNLALIPLGSDGTFSIYNHVGNIHVIADVQGYVSDS